MKRKKSIKERLREWDADAFDLTERTAGPMHPAPAAPEEEKPEEPPAPDTRVRVSEALRTCRPARPLRSNHRQPAYCVSS